MTARPAPAGPPRRVVVTGAARGIGAACGALLHEHGYLVVGVDLDQPDAGIPDWAERFAEVDVTDAAAVDHLRDSLEYVDILVNSAGIVGPNMPIWEVTDDAWQRTIDVNLNGVFHTLRAFLPAMRAAKWGRVVNIASIAGKEGNPNIAAYSGSKAAVIGLTKAVAKEVATEGVLVHSIAPAVIATEMNANTDPKVLEYMISRIPMGRSGTAEEVAQLVRWLVSDECTFTTGACHDVSGGRATY